LRALYSDSLASLKKTLESSGYGGSRKEVEKLEDRIVREVFRDFQKYGGDIKEDIGQAMLARQLPQSQLLKRSVQTDKQVLATLKLIKNDRRFYSMLTKGGVLERKVSCSDVSNSNEYLNRNRAFTLNW